MGGFGQFLDNQRRHDARDHRDCYLFCDLLAHEKGPTVSSGAIWTGTGKNARLRTYYVSRKIAALKLYFAARGLALYGMDVLQVLERANVCNAPIGGIARGLYIRCIAAERYALCQVATKAH